ncbi:unnamed protein product [Tetraodon nigroviridis]|uniref:(spotted green pufferfish) hypothetical protein n=1 Tax=Tetraodon nigroviridis TaxID=99883 RepID=Q4TJ91_TETNG|nr:unnamed protein product [Tetraodon nigroviridis]
MARRGRSLSGTVADQLGRGAAQLMVFIRTLLDDFTTEEELLTLPPLKTTTRGADRVPKVPAARLRHPAAGLLPPSEDDKQHQQQNLRGSRPCVCGGHYWQTEQLNCELQDKAGTAADVMVLRDDASASEAFDNVAEKCSQVTKTPGQDLENRFRDLDQLEPCVLYISNPFMNVDRS